MKIFRYQKNYKFPPKGLSVAMGNFDGLHIGHKSVINLARPQVKSVKFGIVTFEPHPRELFFPERKSFRLMTQAAKRIGLERLGLDYLIEIPFTKEISRLTPTLFVEKILYEYFGLTHIVVGEDFKFGQYRKGTAQMLKELGTAFSTDVTIAPIVKKNDFEISSTAIRQALTNGTPEKAAEMLGDWYSVVGMVLEGDKRGRTLGYPTINLHMENLHLPKFGVYSSIVEVLTGTHKGSYLSAVSIGERPTYGKNKPNLEAHLLDFSGDLYGEEVSVSLIAFQRPEQFFNSSHELIAQMNIDCDTTRQTLQNHKNHKNHDKNDS